MKALLNASLGKEDLLIAAGSLPEDFKKAYPDKPLAITAGVEGNLSSIRITQGDIMLPGAFQMNVTGSMESVTDSIRRTGEIQLKARSGNLDFLLAMLPAPNGINLPFRQDSVEGGSYSRKSRIPHRACSYPR